MAVNRRKPVRAYGFNEPLQNLAPLPIVANRAPSANDIAEVGTIWVDTAANVMYGLVDLNPVTWASSPAAGATTLASLDITGAAGTVLDVQGAGTTSVISSSTINFDNAAGLTTISGDLTVAGVTTINGDFDLSSAQLIDLVSTLNAAPSILLHANGGVLEQIRLHADQGTSVNSIELDSDVGGITLVSGLASDDAINLNATAGGVDVDGALQVNIASSQNAASAIVIDASSGGMDLTAAGAAGEDIDIVNTAGSININSGEVIADSMVLTSAGGLDFVVAGTGALDIDMTNTAGAINLTSAQAAADAIIFEASGAAGGLQIRAGSAGILIGNEADTAIIDIGDVVPTSARTITVSGGAVATAIADTLDLAPDGATTDAGASKVVNVNTGALDTATLTTNIGSGNVASGTHAVNVSTGTGTKTVNLGNADGLTTFNIDAITLINDSINVNTSINTGTSTGTVAIGNGAAGAVTVDSGAGISLDAATASNFTVTGATQDLTLSSVGGSVLVSSTEDAALAIRLHANGGITETIQLHADQGTAVNSIDLLSDVGGITLTATGLASADAINLNAPAGGVDIDGALQVNIDSAQAAAVDSVRIVASAADGGMDLDSGTSGTTIDSTGAISIDGAAASNFSVSGAGIDLTLASAAGRVVVNGEEAAADAIRLLSAAGGIDADAALQVNIASSQNAADSIVIESSAGGVNILASGASAGEDIDIIATGSSVNIISTEAIADAIVINASNAAAGIDLLTGGGEISIASSGNVSMVPGTATAASPTTNVTINQRVGVATFTGYTTGAGASETFTVTNSAVGVGDGVFMTVSNTGSNNAHVTLDGVSTQTAGTLDLQVTNNGSAAVNGSIIVTFWVIN